VINKEPTKHDCLVGFFNLRVNLGILLRGVLQQEIDEFSKQTVYLLLYFNKTIKAMALIGYGEADFHSMVTKGHHFVDRTSFIATQESLGNRNLERT
jgi:hypothetical protein